MQQNFTLKLYLTTFCGAFGLFAVSTLVISSFSSLWTQKTETCINNNPTSLWCDIMLAGSDHRSSPSSRTFSVKSSWSGGFTRVFPCIHSSPSAVSVASSSSYITKEVWNPKILLKDMWQKIHFYLDEKWFESYPFLSCSFDTLCHRCLWLGVNVRCLHFRREDINLMVLTTVQFNSQLK